MRIVLALATVIALADCAKAQQSAATAASAAAENPASASDGATIYNENCSSCHQADGKGIPEAFPPLAGNPTVTGTPVAVITIVKSGLEGRVTVAGQAYSGIMPRWQGVLSDAQIASVVSYIRSSWKNNASGVSVDEVKAVK